MDDACRLLRGVLFLVCDGVYSINSSSRSGSFPALLALLLVGAAGYLLPRPRIIDVIFWSSPPPPTRTMPHPANNGAPPHFMPNEKRKTKNENIKQQEQSHLLLFHLGAGIFRAAMTIELGAWCAAPLMERPFYHDEAYKYQSGTRRLCEATECCVRNLAI